MKSGREETVEDKQGDGAVEEMESSSKRFYGCYLLVSLSPRHKGTPISGGFTVNPRRRIRQHNGELRSGAWRTKNKRPWEMVLCIFGFPNNVSALHVVLSGRGQHPRVSIAVREAAANCKSLSGIANKIKLAYAMLMLPPWQSLNITVNYFSTKYLNHSAGCVNLPKQIKVRVCPMDELRCYVDGSMNLIESDSDWEEESFTNVAVHTLPANELLESSKAFDRQQLGEAPTFIVQGRQESSFVNSPIRALSPVMPSLSSLEHTPNGRNVFMFIEEFSVGLENNQPSILIKDRGSTSSNPVTSQEVEIIELASPSPDPRGKELHGKRRRVSMAYPEIIDLTDSPVFVQL